MTNLIIWLSPSSFSAIVGQNTGILNALTFSLMKEPLLSTTAHQLILAFLLWLKDTISNMLV
jgi:hypothetical protein